MEEELYTPIEVAAQLKVTKQAVYKWMKDGRLSYVIVGSERRITSAAIKEFIRRGTEEDAAKQKTPGLGLASANY